VEKSLSSELKIVEQLLLENINALNSPLSTLIHAQLPQCYPLARAAVTLTASDRTHIGQSKPILEYPPYIYLATALETLHLALKIHEVLINESSISSAKPQPSKTLIGGTILAGDYCFSCSARLSAMTNNPLVVEFYTGIMASAALSHQPVEPYHASALQMSLQLTIFLQEHKAENEKIIDRKIASLSEYQEESWSDFMVWLDQEKST